MNKKIQIIRALAICAVVMIHSNTDGVVGVGVRPFINYAVAMFIFCSGYLTKLEINDLGSFYKKRIGRVIVPYLLWSLIYTVAYGSYSSLIVNLLTANAHHSFYYIFVYIQLVLLTPAIGRLLKSKYRWIGWAIAPISVLIIRYICTFAGVELGFPFPATLCLVWFTYYYLGLGLGNHVFEYGDSWKKTIGMYAVVLLLSEVEGFVWMIYGNYDLATSQVRLTSILTSTVACLLAYRYIKDDGVELADSLLSRALITIGNCSFGIYLSHNLVMSVLERVPGYGYLFFPLRSIVILAVTTLCVMAGHRVLGRYAKLAGL